MLFLNENIALNRHSENYYCMWIYKLIAIAYNPMSIILGKDKKWGPFWDPLHLF